MDGEISTVHPHEINIWISGVRSSVSLAPPPHTHTHTLDDLEEMDGEISTVHPHEINIWISGVRSSLCAANQWHA